MQVRILKDLGDARFPVGELVDESEIPEFRREQLVKYRYIEPASNPTGFEVVKSLPFGDRNLPTGTKLGLDAIEDPQRLADLERLDYIKPVYESQRCEAVTARGNRCKGEALDGSRYCKREAHQRLEG